MTYSSSSAFYRLGYSISWNAINSPLYFHKSVRLNIVLNTFLKGMLKYFRIKLVKWVSHAEGRYFKLALIVLDRAYPEFYKIRYKHKRLIFSAWNFLYFNKMTHNLSQLRDFHTVAVYKPKFRLGSGKFWHKFYKSMFFSLGKKFLHAKKAVKNGTIDLEAGHPERESILKSGVYEHYNRVKFSKIPHYQFMFRFYFKLYNYLLKMKFSAIFLSKRNFKLKLFTEFVLLNAFLAKDLIYVWRRPLRRFYSRFINAGRAYYSFSRRVIPDYEFHFNYSNYIKGANYGWRGAGRIAKHYKEPKRNIAAWSSLFLKGYFSNRSFKKIIRRRVFGMDDERSTERIKLANFLIRNHIFWKKRKNNNIEFQANEFFYSKSFLRNATCRLLKSLFPVILKKKQHKLKYLRKMFRKSYRKNSVNWIQSVEAQFELDLINYLKYQKFSDLFFTDKYFFSDQANSYINRFGFFRKKEKLFLKTRLNFFIKSSRFLLGTRWKFISKKKRKRKSFLIKKLIYLNSLRVKELKAFPFVSTQLLLKNESISFFRRNLVLNKWNNPFNFVFDNFLLFLKFFNFDFLINKRKKKKEVVEDFLNPEILFDNKIVPVESSSLKGYFKAFYAIEFYLKLVQYNIVLNRRWNANKLIRSIALFRFFWSLEFYKLYFNFKFRRHNFEKVFKRNYNNIYKDVKTKVPVVMLKRPFSARIKIRKLPKQTSKNIFYAVRRVDKILEKTRRQINVCAYSSFINYTWLCRTYPKFGVASNEVDLKKKLPYMIKNFAIIRKLNKLSFMSYLVFSMFPKKDAVFYVLALSTLFNNKANSLLKFFGKYKRWMFNLSMSYKMFTYKSFNFLKREVEIGDKFLFDKVGGFNFVNWILFKAEKKKYFLVCSKKRSDFFLFLRKLDNFLYSKGWKTEFKKMYFYRSKFFRKHLYRKFHKKINFFNKTEHYRNINKAKVLFKSCRKFFKIQKEFRKIHGELSRMLKFSDSLAKHKKFRYTSPLLLKNLESVKFFNSKFKSNEDFLFILIIRFINTNINMLYSENSYNCYKFFFLNLFAGRSKNMYIQKSLIRQRKDQLYYALNKLLNYKKVYKLLNAIKKPTFTFVYKKLCRIWRKLSRRFLMRNSKIKFDNISPRLVVNNKNTLKKNRVSQWLGNKSYYLTKWDFTRARQWEFNKIARQWGSTTARQWELTRARQWAFAGSYNVFKERTGYKINKISSFINLKSHKLRRTFFFNNYFKNLPRKVSYKPSYIEEYTTSIIRYVAALRKLKLEMLEYEAERKKKLLKPVVRVWKKKRNFGLISRNKFKSRQTYRLYRRISNSELRFEREKAALLRLGKKGKRKFYRYYMLQRNISRKLIKAQPKFVSKQFHNYYSWFKQIQHPRILKMKGVCRVLFDFRKYYSFKQKFYFKKAIKSPEQFSSKAEFESSFLYLNELKKRPIWPVAWNVTKKAYHSNFFLNKVKYVSVKNKRTGKSYVTSPFSGNFMSKIRQYDHAYLRFAEFAYFTTNKLFDKFRFKWIRDFYLKSEHLNLFILLNKKIYYTLKSDQLARTKILKVKLIKKIKVCKSKVWGAVNKLNFRNDNRAAFAINSMDVFYLLLKLIANLRFLALLRVNNKRLSLFIGFTLKNLGNLSKVLTEKNCKIANNIVVGDSVSEKGLRRLLNWQKKTISKNVTLKKKVFINLALKKHTLRNLALKKKVLSLWALKNKPFYNKIFKNKKILNYLICWFKNYVLNKNFININKRVAHQVLSNPDNIINFHISDSYRVELDDSWNELFLGKFLRFFDVNVDLKNYLSINKFEILTEYVRLKNTLDFVIFFLYNFFTNLRNTKKLMNPVYTLKKIYKLKVLSILVSRKVSRGGVSQKKRKLPILLSKKFSSFSYIYSENFEVLPEFIFLSRFLNTINFKIFRSKNGCYFDRDGYSTIHWIRNKKFSFWIEQQLEKSFKFNVKLHYIRSVKAVAKFFRGSTDFFSYTIRIYLYRLMGGWRQQTIYADILWIILIAVKYYSSSFLSNMIAEQMVKRKKQWPFIKIVRSTITDILPKNMINNPIRIDGFRIGINGKINGRDRSINFLMYKYFRDSQVTKILPIFLKVDYSLSFANSKYGVFGIRVWISRL